MNHKKELLRNLWVITARGLYGDYGSVSEILRSTRLQNPEARRHGLNFGFRVSLNSKPWNTTHSLHV